MKVYVYPAADLSRPGRTAAVLRPSDDLRTGAIVYRCADQEGAREEAGALGGSAFWKGRFAFAVYGPTSPEESAKCVAFLDGIANALR